MLNYFSKFHYDNYLTEHKALSKKLECNLDALMRTKHTMLTSQLRLAPWSSAFCLPGLLQVNTEEKQAYEEVVRVLSWRSSAAVRGQKSCPALRWQATKVWTVQRNSAQKITAYYWVLHGLLPVNERTISSFVWNGKGHIRVGIPLTHKQASRQADWRLPQQPKRQGFYWHH